MLHLYYECNICKNSIVNGKSSNNFIAASVHVLFVIDNYTHEYSVGHIIADLWMKKNCDYCHSY